ncbi:unnamed protein product [Lota lota]
MIAAWFLASDGCSAGAPCCWRHLRFVYPAVAHMILPWLFPRPAGNLLHWPRALARSYTPAPQAAADSVVASVRVESPVPSNVRGT